MSLFAQKHYDCPTCRCAEPVNACTQDTCIEALVKAADAVVDRWKQPTWKDAGPTGQFIGELETAIAAFKDATK